MIRIYLTREQVEGHHEGCGCCACDEPANIIDIEKLLNPALLYQINNRADSVAQLSPVVEAARVNAFVDMPEKIMIPPIEENTKLRLLKNFYTTKSLFIAYMRANMLEKQMAVETLELVRKEYHLQ